MTTINIAGVPEHFNYPWQLCFERGAFQSQNINLQWTNVPEGTGKMCELLRQGKTDMAVILTEGIVKDILAGNPSKIVQVYVGTPLIWGIHVATKSPYKSLSDLENTTAAISRIGSGSQLMAYVNARNQNWSAKDLKFQVVNTIDGAVEALSNGTTDYLMWEHFMTKPLVDQGFLRRIDDCPTPWPCFVIAVRNEILESHPQTIRTILDIINAETQKFKKIQNIETQLASVFQQKKEDIASWLSLTEWSQELPEERMLNNVQNQLLELALIDKKGTFAEIVKAL